MSFDSTPTFKVVLVGDAGTGRKTFLNQFIQGAANAHPAPNGLEEKALIYPISLETTLGPVKLDCWVYLNNNNERGGTGDQPDLPPDEFYLHANAGLVFFDLTSRVTYKNVPSHYRDIVRVCDNIPIALVGSKNDCFNDRKIKIKQIIFHRKKNLFYHDISSKAQYNLLKPFLSLLRKLTECPDLEYAHKPNLCEPEIPWESDERMVSEYKELELAIETGFAPLPPDSDEGF